MQYINSFRIYIYQFLHSILNSIDKSEKKIYINSIIYA